MANDTTGNPWSIDTAGVLTTRPVAVDRIIWESPTADGDDIDIVNNAGHKVYTIKAIAGGTGISYEREIGNVVAGINVATIDSGTLYIYIR